MSKIKTVDMLHGNLLRSIILFSFPLLLVGLIQNLFHSVDMIVLGNMADTNAVAAVGATGAISSLLINMALGISNGTKIVLARLLGEGEDEKSRQTVYTSITTALGLGFGVAVIGVVLSPLFLRITNCPEEIFKGAQIYLQIYFAASPAILLYNFGSNILQVNGDSQRPLYYMIASGLLNAGLNILLCFILPNKVFAVAIATASSHVLGSILVTRRLLGMEGPCRLNLREKAWNGSIFRKLMANGIPLGLSSSLYPLANLQIQSAINSFGPAAIAGNSASSNVENLKNAIVATPWSSSAGVFVGKNVGANNKPRVKRSILYCLYISCGLTAVLSALLFIFSEPLLSLYVSDESAIVFGQIRMKYTVLPHVIAATMSVLGSVIAAFGYAIFGTLNSVVSVLLFRAFWMAVVFPISPTYDMLMLCFTVSWCLALLLSASFFAYIYFFKFKKDRIKKMG